MKFISQYIQFTLFTSLLFILPKSAKAQIPNTGIFFQAVARDNFTNPAKDRKIYVQSNIVQNSNTGTIILQEEFQTNTDASGIFGISIGLGNRIGGSKADLQSIDWANGPYALQLKIAIEPIAPVANWDYTKNWIELGSTPFGAVPYALYSNTSGSIGRKLNITDTSAMLRPYQNAIRALQINSNTITESLLTNSLIKKLNYSDTANMLSGYLRVGAIVPFSGTFSYNNLSNTPDLNSKESIINKSNNIQIDASSDIKYPSVKAVKTYIDAAITNINSGNASVTISDADFSTKGIIKLIGDLGGTADSIIINANAISTNKIATGAVTDAKIASGINPSKVGLGNVDNTNDLDKPISTATQAALDLKLNVSAGNSLNTLINSKLNISDTARWINSRIARDTSFLSSRINSKINIIDSNAIFATPTYIDNRIDLKVNTSDTARMLANYAILSNLSPIATTGNYNDLINKPTFQNSSVTSVNAQTGDIIIDKAAINLGNVDNTTDLNKPISTLTSVALNNKADISLMNVPNGFAGLDGNGKIPSNLLPPISFSSVAIAASAAEMINLGTTSSKGTICIRTDLSKSFVLSIDYSAQANDWIEILTPGAPVQSINGRTGTVSLSTTDIIEGTNQYFTQTKARIAMGANAPINYSISTGIFSADTLTSVSGLATRGYLLQQLGNTNSRILNKLNIIDTANMLNPYTRNTTLTNLLSNKLNLSDTSFLLNNRIGRDTIALSNRIYLKLNLSDTSAMLANYLTNSFTKESINNKSNDTTLGGILASNNFYPTQYAVKKYIENNSASISTASSTNTGTVVDATTTTKGKIQLAGDLAGSASLPIVVSISGVSKDSIFNAMNLMNNANSNNIANTIVKRSPIGDFSGATITASTFRGALIGSVTGNLTGNVTGNLVGTVTGNATNVSGVVAIANGGTGGLNASQARTNLGLSNIDNTSDASKPVSSAQQTAIDLKANLASPTFSGNVVLPSNTVGITQSLNDNSAKIATTEYVANALADANITITNAVADATTTTKGKILLAGDLGGTATLPIVVSVGGKTKEEILTAVNDISTATNSNTANSIVKRDGNGTFYGNILGNATNITGIVDIANGGTGTSSVAGFKSNFALDNIDNTSDLNKPLSIATSNALSLKINNSVIASANGVASLGADGKIPTAQLPTFSITTVNVVNSQANMLALTGLSVGAVAIRTDNSTNYILTTLPASTIANWQTFYPASTNIQSVNGLTGAIALTGTNNRLTISANNIFDISSNYIGQSTINTVGTITTGVWNSTAIPITNGGTGSTNANAAFNSLAPSQAGKNGFILTSNGTNVSWASVETTGGWSTSGNAGLTDGAYYLGTTDAQPLNFKAGNLPAGRIDVSSIIGQTSLGYGAAYHAQRSTTASTYYGTKNTSIGYQANYYSTYGKENTALGYQALTATNRTSGSTAIGFQAMSNYDNNYSSATDFISYNSALGYQAMQGSAMPASNTGTNNTAIGYQALKAMTSGAYNATVGALSLSNNTTGGYNSALGYYALYSNTTGYYNTAIGISAAYNNTTGIGNIAIGSSALSSNTTGNFNTAIGHSANVTDGLTNAIAIGYNASNSTSNTIQLGNGNITKVNTSGAFVSTNGTNATSTSTGSLIISGGAGISGNAYVGGLLNVAGTTTFAGATTFNGGIYALGIYGNTLNNITVQNTSTLSGATNIAGVTTISNATASTASNNGALVVTGGTGIVGALNVGGNTTIAGTTTLKSISYGTTPTTNDNSNKIATTAFVMNTLASPNNNFAWSTSGNAGLTDGAYYLGTTDAQPLNFKAGNLPAGRIDVSSIIGQTSLGYGAAYHAQRSTTASTYYGTKNTSIGYQANYNSHYGKENTALGYQALFSTFRTSGSTAIGFQAMSNYNDNLSTASDFISYNSALGYQAMQGSATPASNTGTNNTAIGYQALKAMTSGAQNATVGALSLSNNTTGGYNSALGYYALYSNTTGYYNTAIGNNTMSSNTTGGYNSALGYYALYSNTTGYYNTAIGISAAYNITTGIGNIAIGFNALSSNTTGNFNTAIGHSANVTDGLTNAIAIGYNASNSTSNTIQLGNSAITKLSTYGALVSTNGTNATSTSTGSLIISGGAGISGNAFVGGLLNVAGTTTLNGISYGTTPTTNDNSTKIATTAFVMNTLASPSNGRAFSTTGNSGMVDGTNFIGTTDAQPLNIKTNNTNSGRIDVDIIKGQVSFGYGAAAQTSLSNASPYNGTKNTAIGYQAINTTIIGKENTALGYQALNNNSSGSSSVAIGYQAMSNANNSASSTDFRTYNTAIGYQALQGSPTPVNNTGTNNTTVGYQSLKANTSGAYNSSLGSSVLINNTSGGSNTAIGYNSLNANTTGNYNNALGRNAMSNNLTGTGNIAIGYNALSSNTTGNYNIAVGYGANVTDGLTNAISIGQNATNSTSNSIQLGNTSITKVNTSGAITTSSDLVANHIKGNSAAPTIATSTGAGTSPTGITVVGTDMSGVVTLTTGTNPSINSVLATISYNTAYSSSPIVVITPANAATASLAAAQAVWVNIGTSNFTINTNVTAINAITTYKWNYAVIQ